jgi:hypothetical protein
VQHHETKGRIGVDRSSNDRVGEHAAMNRPRIAEGGPLPKTQIDWFSKKPRCTAFEISS